MFGSMAAASSRGRKPAGAMYTIVRDTTMQARHRWRRAVSPVPVASGLVFMLGIGAAARPVLQSQRLPTSAFKVANWNVRSGMGIEGKKPQIDHNTTDCRLNASKPGGPFWPAMDVVKTDAEVVALGVQEAWACATPEAIRAYLEWREATPERNGTALVTRHGLRGRHVVEQIAFKGVEGASEDQWLFGGDVIDAACSSTVRIYSAHFTAPDDVGFTAQARNTIAYVKSQPSAGRNIIVGDLNFFKANRTLRPMRARRARRRRRPMCSRAAEYVDAWQALKPGIDGPTGMWESPRLRQP